MKIQKTGVVEVVFDKNAYYIVPRLKKNCIN